VNGSAIHQVFPFGTLNLILLQLRTAGFSVLKYEVRFHSELSHPLFLVAMMLIGCAFTMKNFIGNKKSLAVIASIMLGFSL